MAPFWNKLDKHRMKKIGIVLIVIGIVMLVVRGFTYTKQEKVAEIGPIEINAKEKKKVSWPLYAGGVIAVAGLVLVLFDKKSGSGS